MITAVIMITVMTTITAMIMIIPEMIIPEMTMIIPEMTVILMMVVPMTADLTTVETDVWITDF